VIVDVIVLLLMLVVGYVTFDCVDVVDCCYWTLLLTPGCWTVDLLLLITVWLIALFIICYCCYCVVLTCIVVVIVTLIYLLLLLLPFICWTLVIPVVLLLRLLAGDVCLC